MRQTWLRLAFAALASLAVLSCGGDDGANTGDGNNNGGTDDGNGDDTAGPNPLIEKIEGAWEITDSVRITTDADGNEHRETIERGSSPVLYVGEYFWIRPADPNDHDCRSRSTQMGAPRGEPLGPSGDACVDWFEDPYVFILDGERARVHVALCGSSPCIEYRMEGQFLDAGRHFEYTVEYTASDAEARPMEGYRREVKARWYTAECVSTIDEEYGCGIIPSPGYAIPSED